MKSPAWTQRLVERALEPRRAEAALQQLAERWPASLPPLEKVCLDFVDQGAALAHLFSISPISAHKLQVDPAALLWLVRGDIHDATRGLRRMRADYDALRTQLEGADASFNARFESLRRWKAREMLRLALREVAGWSSIEQSTLELTMAAEFCLEIICLGWFEELARKWGRPATPFAVLGMGKLGGRELNYSSDIDVMLFFGEDGRLNPRFSHQEFFARLAEKIIATFSTADPAGPLFRIDLRLRPEGVSGPLVRSLESMEQYYAAFGETWERMALIKARVVAGTGDSREIGYEFAQRLQAFIYPRTVSLDVLEEIRAIKARIEQEIVGTAQLRRNVKLGYGGIREIEFVTQMLQLLHGARHPFLQEGSTLKALRNLRELNLIPHEDMETLSLAYCWLRTVEHRLQIEEEAQTHTLPDRPEALALLAASLGFESAAEFDAQLIRQTNAVRAIFDKVLAAPGAPGELVVKRDLRFFRDPAQAERALTDLGGPGTTARFSPRTKRHFARLEPSLLEWLRRVADPDTALNSFVRFVERYGTRGLLYETLLVNPRVLEVLVRLFDASASMAEIVLRRPQLIEEVARTGLGESLKVDDYLAGLAHNDEGIPWREWLRVFRRSQYLRIGLRDVLGFAQLRDVHTEFTALAEACLLFAQRELGVADVLTVVAMGKFGGRELGYGADLDVLFLGEETKAAAELMRALSTVTAEGAVFRVDPRLRPEGDAGPLCCSLAAYQAYFGKRGQLWEAQALTKARPISGPEQAQFAEVAQAIWRRFGSREELFPRIAEMHGRVVKERAAAADLLDFKTGTGGLMQAEFFVQAHQLRAGVWEPNTLRAIEKLTAQEILRPESARSLAGSYQFLRGVESVLRRHDDKSISALPDDPAGRHAVAIRCGFSTAEQFLERYREARESIRAQARL